MTDTPTRFYQAFSRLDHATMATCYSPGARFVDPVFDVSGDDIGAMWKSLCEAATDLEITFDVVDFNDSAALVDWEAVYTFPPTGRTVHNRIQARMSIIEGLIVEHTDVFDFYKWARQAFGPAGVLIGWAPPFKKRVRERAVGGIHRTSR